MNPGIFTVTYKKYAIGCFKLDMIDLLFRQVLRTIFVKRVTVYLLCIFGGWLIAGGASAGCRDAPQPGVDWSDCTKKQLVLRRENLSGGTFTKTYFTSTDFTESDLSGAQFSETDLSLANLSGTNLTNASMVKVHAMRAWFENSDLTSAVIRKSEMTRASFSGANLTGADLSQSEFNRAIFKDAQLSGVNFAKAELARADLTGHQLAGIDFSYANLSRADFRGTSLGDALMDGSYMFLTRIEGADLSNVSMLNQDQLDLACGDDATKLPAGLTVPAEWPCQGLDD